MNNPVNMILSQMQKGINPTAILQMMSRDNPQVAQVLRITQGKSPAELRQYAQNLAKERGIDLYDFMRSMGISIPSNR